MKLLAALTIVLVLVMTNPNGRSSLLGAASNIFHGAQDGVASSVRGMVGLR